MKTKTDDVRVYHCISCGRIQHVALDAVVPECCGTAMTMSCDTNDDDRNADSALRSIPTVSTEAGKSSRPKSAK